MRTKRFRLGIKGVLIALTWMLFAPYKVQAQYESNAVAAYSEIWHTDFVIAQQEAQITNKPIVMVFSGSDWCMPCILLKAQILDTNPFVEYALENYVLMNVDFPRETLTHGVFSDAQIELIKKYNPTRGVPTVLVVHPNGRILGQVKHQRNITPQEYIWQINSFVRQGGIR
ncbi:MAG: thioredoxin family protein [Chitinophagales bacterium]